jgi:hypothetical protein
MSDNYDMVVTGAHGLTTQGNQNYRCSDKENQKSCDGYKKRVALECKEPLVVLL